jgi:hypothetical protein
MLNPDPFGRIWVSKGLRQREDNLVLHWLQMKMQLSREQQITCHEAAISHYKADTFLHPGMDSTYTKDKNLHELIAQYAEALGAEWIVAKYLGVDYDPFVSKHKEAADVSSNIEVRWTKYVAGQLIVHEYDRSNDIAILVTGQAPHYFIAGWIPIAMAQRPKYRHSKQPNWWVTQINLQPIENLRKSNYGQSSI